MASMEKRSQPKADPPLAEKIRQSLISTFDCIKKDPLTVLIILAAFTLYMLVILPSGSRYCFDGKCGVYFWGAHEHDGIWHLALIESAFKTWPFRFPTFAGQTLSGYNYLLDVVLYIFTFIGLSASFLYFKVQSIVWFAVFGYLLYRLGKMVHKEKGFIHFLFVFVFFGSSFGFLIQWIKHGTLVGSAGIPTMQGALSMTNPQFMWSLCVLLAMWIIIKSKNNLWLVGPLIFIGLGLKFYFIVPAIVLVGWMLTELFIQRQYKSLLITGISLGLSTLLAYAAFYAGQGANSGGLIWKPFEITHQIVEDPNMWYDKEMVNQRYYLIQLGNLWSPRLWWIEIRTILYFLFFNYGIRILGILFAPIVFIFHRSTRKDIAILYITTILATIVPILFIQKGVWWNTIQFLYYGIFMAGIMSAYVYWIIMRRAHAVFHIVIAAIFILLFIPSIVDISQTFGSTKNVNYISDKEIVALRFLRKMPDGVVLTQPYTREQGNILSTQYDTAYVSAYTGKQTYVADETQLVLLGVASGKRLRDVQQAPCSELSKVQYIYLRRRASNYASFSCLTTDPRVSRIYTNSEVEIWKIRRL